uniref:Uncharacterized protein n=1 Tax=viral metagenome TaxID=1070528 RepID=A0A6C0L5Y8_9ZZZZ
MRRVQLGAPITDFGQRKPISFDALFSSDSESDTEMSAVEEKVDTPVAVAIPLATVNTNANANATANASATATANASENRKFNISPTNISDVKAIFKNTIERSASPDYLPYDKSDDPISTWTQKVTESFERASEKKTDGFSSLTPDFKESLGRLSFFRRPMAT